MYKTFFVLGLVFISCSIISYGLTVRTVVAIAVAIATIAIAAVSVAVFITLVTTTYNTRNTELNLISSFFAGFDINSQIAYNFAGAFAGSVIGSVASSITFAFAVVVASAGSITFASVVSKNAISSIASIVAFASIVDIAGVATSTTVGIAAVGLSIPVAAIGAMLSAYIAWQALEGNEKFALLRTFGVVFGSMGGTCFYKAELTKVNFTNALLKSCNFREAELTHVCWHAARKLDYARLGNSILSNPAVRELLVTRNGYKKSYVDANLRNANLNGVNLNEASLKWADLSETTLRHADLRDTDLSETLVLGADFTRASLTGACLEGWNIDHTTKLEGVDCQYIYLLRNQQERRPSSGDFAPGEFTKLFQEALSTVDLIFRNGVDWKAFVTAFQQVQVENENTPWKFRVLKTKEMV